MSEIGMKISPGKLFFDINILDYYDYMRYAFINQTCNKRREDGVSYRMCSCRGNNFFGMPDLVFNTF